MFGSLQHIKCFTTPRTPTLSHTLFSHAPCVTPHPMTGCLAVIQFSRWATDPTSLDFVRCSLHSRASLDNKLALLYFLCLWSILTVYISSVVVFISLDCTQVLSTYSQLSSQNYQLGVYQPIRTIFRM